MSAEPGFTPRARSLRGLLLLLALLTLIALAGMLAACGDESDTGRGEGAAVLTPASLIRVADKTSATSGVRMSMRQTTTIPGQGSVPMTGEGRFDTKRQRGEMTMSIDAGALGAAAGADQAGELKLRMIVDGLTVYMRPPTAGAPLPGGKRWMKLDLAAIGKQVGLDFGAFMSQGAGQDPTQVLAYLKAASGDVQRVGTDTVRGVATTHYRATVDFRNVADSAPADQRAAMRRSIDRLITLTGAQTTPIEVWIDGDGLARRLETQMAMGAAAMHVKVRQRIELYDFGAKVDVKVPPASETVDLGDLGDLSSGGGASSGTLFG